MQLKLTVNGAARSDEVEPRLLLVHYLREVLGLRAANVGCDTTSCGACTARTVHDLTDSPFSSTVHAPQDVVSQPTLAARRPATSRR